MVLRADEENLTNFYVGPKSRWCMEALFCTWGCWNWKFWYSQELRTVFLHMSRENEQELYSQDLEHNWGMIYTFHRAMTIVPQDSQRKISLCIISQLLGLPITFRVVLLCGFLEGTTHTSCQKDLWFGLWQEMTGTCITNSATPAAVPALGQKVSSWPVVSHYKSLATGLQRKYNQTLLRFDFSHIHWKYQNQIEHRNKNDAYRAKYNGWLFLIYEILVFIFWGATHRVWFSCRIFSHLFIISSKCSSSLLLGVCPVHYVLSKALPALLGKKLGFKFYA